MSKPHPGSLNDHLSKLQVGGRLYVERTADDYMKLQSLSTLKTRRPASMAEMEFTSSVFTAVSASRVGDVRILVCVERVR